MISLQMLSFTSLVVVLVSGCAFFKMKASDTKDRQRQLLRAYVGNICLAIGSGDIIHYFANGKPIWRILMEVVNGYFVVAEFYLLGRLLSGGYLLFKGIDLIKALSFCFAIAAIAIVAAGLHPAAIAKLTSLRSERLAAVELSLLALFCLDYFRRVNKSGKSIPLPKAILLLGIFAYTVLSVPFFCLATYFESSRLLKYYYGFFFVHYLSLLALCVAILYFAFSAKPSASDVLV